MIIHSLSFMEAVKGDLKLAAVTPEMICDQTPDYQSHLRYFSILIAK
jgi:hypothetical protein